MSSPSSTPWRRATPNGCSSRGTRRRKPSEQETGSCAGVPGTVPAQPRPLEATPTAHPSCSEAEHVCVPCPGLVPPVLPPVGVCSGCSLKPRLTSDVAAALAGAAALCKMGKPDFLVNIRLIIEFSNRCVNVGTARERARSLQGVLFCPVQSLVLLSGWGKAI